MQTLWGWIGLRLGGKKGYELLTENDQARVAPGGDELLKLFGDKANLILLDEVLEYLSTAGGVRVEKTDLREQTLNFLKDLALTFRAGRNDLYAAWPALANLADLTGEVSVTVTASSETPLDKGKLENGVYEPLRELGLLKE